MDVGSVLGNSYNAGLAKTTAKTKAEETEKAKKAASATETGDTTEDKDVDAYYDINTVRIMSDESATKTEQLKNLVEKLINRQSEAFHKAHPEESLNEEGLTGKLKSFFEDLEVDPETAEQAKKDIGDGGYYSVEKTAGRILDFAKALAGNDPEKAEKMYSAVMSGFEEAEKMWGGKLPEISSKTLEAVKKGFEDWRNEMAVSQ